MWVLENPKYLSWCQAENASLLWVSADPGCGKLVLAKALVDEKHLIPRSETTSICYFFFKDDDPARQTGANALSTILHQLFVQRPALLQYAIKDFRNNGGQLCNMFSTLWEILINAATDPNAGEIVCVLDALDETRESAREELLSYLSEFYAYRDETTAKLYFLVTSRPYADIERGFYWGDDEATCISLKGENESDQISKEIDIVIDDQLPRIANARRPRLDPEVLSRLNTHLKLTPHRTYLWLHLIFDIIRKSLDSTAPRLERLVNTLPQTVEEAYEKILNRSNHRKSARRLLHMVVGAIRSLMLRELNIACVIDELLESGESCQRYSDLDLESEDAFRAKARNVCGLFVIIVDSKIYLIHQTAKEFLLSQTSNDLAEVCQCDSEFWKHSLDPFDSQYIMLKICLSYLLLQELDYPVLLREAKDSRSNSQPQLADSAPPYIFLNYAAKAWSIHFRKSRSRDTGLLLQWALDVCDTQSNRFQRWYLTYKPVSESTYEGRRPRHSRDLSRLTVASYFGLEPIVEVLLKKNGTDLNPRDVSGNTSLSWAIYNGCFETVKLLLEQDNIDINTGSTSLGPPLYLAAKYNHLEIVKLLVEKDGIDLNAKLNRFSTLLQTACLARHYEVAKLLINKDDMHFKNDHEQLPLLSWLDEPTPLMSMAISDGQLEFVELSIERKAFGINQKDYCSRTPLVMAAQDQKPEIVRLLVEKEGIDLNLKGPDGRTPLAWAARRGNAEIVDILLKKDGIEVNSEDADGITPQGIASNYSHGIVYKLLDEYNARYRSD